MRKRSPTYRLGAALLALGHAAGDPARAAVPSPAPKAPVVVSKETTYLLGPLKPDGSVDYAAALNRIQEDGLRPEANAAILFLSVFGPRILGDRPDSPAAIARMGARPPAPAGTYFLTSSEYAARLPETDGAKALDLALLRRACRAPWSESDHPLLAGWLRTNDGALVRLVQATGRPRFWIPLREDSDEWGPPSGLLRLYREAADALCARAMRKLGSNDLMRAWDDLRAADRLAALLAQGGREWDGIIAGAVRAAAAEGIHAFAAHAALSAEQARSILADLAGRSALPDAVDRIDRIQRIESLALVAAARHFGAKEWAIFDVPPAASAAADWNAALRAVNRGFDRFVAAARAPTAMERKRRLQAWEAEVKAAEKQKAITTGMNDLLAVKLGSLSRLTRQIEGVAIADAFHDLGRIAVALAGYRSEKGAFPATLALLAPSWLSQVPLDPLGPRPFGYARRNGGYVLYSAGFNRRADKAAGAERGDDIVIRVP